MMRRRGGLQESRSFFFAGFFQERFGSRREWRKRGREFRLVDLVP
jgi:hypothetical protein